MADSHRMPPRPLAEADGQGTSPGPETPQDAGPQTRPSERSPASHAGPGSMISAITAAPTPKGKACVESDFFQLLRRRECARRDLPRIGEARNPRDEALRFGQDPSLAFTAGWLTSIRPTEDGIRDRIAVGFFGLMGANGPLPHHITEYIRDRVRNARDGALSAFLDLFHHRLISLYYRVWASSQPAVSRDRPDQDRFADQVAALIGLARQRPRAGHSRLLDDVKLFHASPFLSGARPPQGLEAIVSDCFGVATRVIEFFPEWVDIPAIHCSHLSAPPVQANKDLSRLGCGARLGTRIWERQHKFRLVLGPLDIGRMPGFLPSGKALPQLRALVHSYVGDELGWDLSLIVARRDLLPLRLGSSAALGIATYLVRARTTAPPEGATFKHIVVDPNRSVVSQP